MEIDYCLIGGGIVGLATAMSLLVTRTERGEPHDTAALCRADSWTA